MCQAMTPHARTWGVVLVVCGVAFGAMACGALPSPARTAVRPNILIVTIDTLRADRLGRGFTPALDQLAADGLQFTNARSAVPLTLPAHASIFTGLWPPDHGVRLNGFPLQTSAITMPARLKQAGYQTAGVVGAFVLDRRFGLAEGFDQYDDQISRDPEAVDRLQADRPASVVVDRALTALGALSSERPWFLWMHVYDPHAPYDPPPDAQARAQGDPYNGEVSFVDEQIGRLLKAVRARPDAGQLAIIVLGDHGESLGEHGEATHGMLVVDAALRIPLIVQAPGLSPAVRQDAASLVDVMPTVLALAGLPAAALPGRDLATGPAPDTETYAETLYPEVAGWSPLRSLVQDRWKLVVAERPRLFDLATDPGETTDVSATRDSTVRAMVARLGAITSANGRTTPASPISAETAARLRSLGYVAPSSLPRTPATGVNGAEYMLDWTSFERAQTLVSAGQATQALGALSRVAGAHPASPLFASSYARALAAAGRSAEALARFRAAVARWPGDADLYHDLAGIARQRGLRDEALRAENAALAINPALPSAHHGKGLVLSDLDRHDEAARAFEEAVRLDQTNAVYHSDLGNARRALGDLTGAASAYTSALERDPHLADAANGLGVVLVQQGRAVEAVRWLELAAADASLQEAPLNLGIALQESGHIERARAQYRKVLESQATRPKEKAAARTLLSQLDKR